MAIQALADGIYRYTQAAREIGAQQGWTEQHVAELTERMLVAIVQKSLKTRSNATGLPNDQPGEIVLHLVHPVDVNEWLGSQQVDYRWEPPKPNPMTVSSEHDYSILASRQELIVVFGIFTGMTMEWFKNLSDRPKLKAACRIAGTAGKRSAEPYFCPYEVMRWLITKPRKGDSRKVLTSDTGFRLLQKNFPKVYNTFSMVDTRGDSTG